MNLWPKRRRCSVPLKSLRLIAAPLAFPSISLRLWRLLFLLAKKWCFQKQAWNLKTCYVLHCRRMQRCWALWTLKQIHYHYLTSKKYKSFTCKCWRERNVQHIISWWQVLFVIITKRSCHQDVMASVGKTLQTWNHFNEMGWWLSLTCGMEDCQIYTSHYDLNWNKPKSCRSSNRGLVVNRSLQPVCFWRLGSCRGTFDRR